MNYSAQRGRFTEQKGAGSCTTGVTAEHKENPAWGGKRGFPNPFGERQGEGGRCSPNRRVNSEKSTKVPQSGAKESARRSERP